MTLIKSISGIRGTIGGAIGDALTPPDVVKYTSAYGTWLKQQHKGVLTVVVGRDARLSGAMVNQLVLATLNSLGIHVIDLGLSTTPTVEVAVTELKTQGGIIITASHNPKQWNALKLLNNKGEFISELDGAQVLALAEAGSFSYTDVNTLGKVEQRHDLLNIHIEKILALPYVDVKAIKSKSFIIALDAINSSGGIAVPLLLEALGVEKIIKIHCEPDGQFAHNPEPLPENLNDLSKAVIKNKAHLGISVDPDVDRLALVCEDGEMFGEEYTLVAVADYVLKHHKKAHTVSNLSSTRALKDITEKAGGKHAAAAVGEVNVVALMKETQSMIGGEGNGGIILPELHYGRDALVGIALFLSHLAKFGKSASLLRSTYPDYHISKNKIELTPEISVDAILEKIKTKYKKQPINTVDGVKIEFNKEWVHLRKSNTEPIIRIYSESDSMATAENLAKKIIQDIKELIKENLSV
ncbi:MAG: phosphoglucosamine mutase [Bacteroidetes bacterium]|nr:phosphoglucosamine mutase [Bacteroidota bacterium]